MTPGAAAAGAARSGLFIGLMSGTSLDGADGVLAQIGADGRVQAKAHAHRSFAEPLRTVLLTLNTSGADELHRSHLAANALARHYAAVVAELLRLARVRPNEVMAIGAHGQTVRHCPASATQASAKASDVNLDGYTTQLNNPSLLAELTGIDVVADFRSRDVAAGGQGAPLAPGFHRVAFGEAGEPIGVLNLGGIANWTFIDAAGGVSAFDTGPANVLLDTWVQRHLGKAYDTNGSWAKAGLVSEGLLAELLTESYFALPPPKSTGRDLFNAAWLDAKLAAFGAAHTRGASLVSPCDVQATLSALTARSVAQAFRWAPSGIHRVVVCGGGARNAHLMAGLAEALPSCRVEASDEMGVPAEQVEAMAFAWLAWRRLAMLPGNLPGATGARGERVLGAWYPR